MSNVIYQQAVESAKRAGLRFYVESVTIDPDGNQYGDDVIFLDTLMDAVDCAVAMINPDTTGPLINDPYDMAYLVIEQSTRPDDPECEDFADVLTVAISTDEYHTSGYDPVTITCVEDLDHMIGQWAETLPTHRVVLYKAS